MERAYTVTGAWPFPLDMLRRDQSHAAAPEDQALINRMSGETSDDEFGTRTEVQINLVMDSGEPTKFRPGGRLLPNGDRWLSFGWRVTSGDADVMLDVQLQELSRVENEREKRDAALRERALAKLDPEERRALGL